MGRKSPGTYLGAFAIIGLAFFLVVFLVRLTFVLALVAFNLSVFLIKVSFKIFRYFYRLCFGKPTVQKDQPDRLVA